MTLKQTIYVQSNAREARNKEAARITRLLIEMAERAYLDFSKAKVVKL
jgi:hypothetical protein